MSYYGPRSARWWYEKTVPYRLRRWFRSPWSCRLGHHVQSDDSWGFGGCVVDWYCKNCDRSIGWTAVDDLTHAQLTNLGLARDVLGIQGLPIGGVSEGVDQ